ncbi:hypothetical protein MA9V2_014 [Chryseobacterium phage MA9V-2]|nr:hypothetical protein MA9V2_014 [Chryseobacterium phage MA9V-2]
MNNNEIRADVEWFKFPKFPPEKVNVYVKWQYPNDTEIHIDVCYLYRAYPKMTKDGYKKLFWFVDKKSNHEAIPMEHVIEWAYENEDDDDPEIPENDMLGTIYEFGRNNWQPGFDGEWIGKWGVFWDYDSTNALIVREIVEDGGDLMYDINHSSALITYDYTITLRNFENSSIMLWGNRYVKQYDGHTEIRTFLTCKYIADTDTYEIRWADEKYSLISLNAAVVQVPASEYLHTDEWQLTIESKRTAYYVAVKNLRTNKTYVV